MLFYRFRASLFLSLFYHTLKEAFLDGFRLDRTVESFDAYDIDAADLGFHFFLDRNGIKNFLIIVQSKLEIYKPAFAEIAKEQNQQRNRIVKRPTNRPFGIIYLFNY